MLISFPFTYFGSATSTASTRRQPATNNNLISYTFSAVTTRFVNIRKKRWVAKNANWTLPQLEFCNFSANNTSESASYPIIVLRQGIKYAGSFYQVTWGGLTETIITAGTQPVSDSVAGVTLLLDTEVEICTRITLPLLFKTQTVNFTVGETVTGATSGATGVVNTGSTDAGATGALVLTSETGTFVNNEILTGSLGGAAVVDLTTTQSLLLSCGTVAVWNEGTKTGNVSSVDWTMSDPVVYPSYTATVNGSGVITALVKVSGGSGYVASPSFFAWEKMADGSIQTKNVGYGNLLAGAVNSGTVSSGTPPTGYVWSSAVKVVACAGTGFGSTTSVVDSSCLTAIPDRPVNSLLGVGDSIMRGFSSTDSTGDEKHNFGIFERSGVANVCGFVNMSTSGGALGNQIQYATTFARQYTACMGKCNYALMELGSNDITSGASLATLKANNSTVKTYIQTFGTLVTNSTLLPRGTPLAITGISKAANAVITCDNSVAGVTAGDVIVVGATAAGTAVAGMTEIRGLSGTVTSANSTTITVNIDSSAFTAYTSGGGVVPPALKQQPATGFGSGGIADQYNSQLIDGTITNNWPVVLARPLYQDVTTSTSWKDSPVALTLDETHPSGSIGIGYASLSTTLASYFTFLG